MATATERLRSRAVALEVGTMVWNAVEALVAVGLGLAAGSVALTGFGFDSVIEVVAAGIVLRHLRTELAGREVDEASERRALRAIAVTFVVLAVYVAASGIHDLVAGARPETSAGGIALTAVSLVVMPTLARAKRRTGDALGNPLVVADSKETALCAWLSVTTLAGLAVYAALGWWWADPVAGFAIAAFAVKEGREAWHGDLCD